jgi:hypothetical protein
MDELDILKKDWNKENPEDKKLSASDIYPMLHKKSSTIVKKLFYISIAELVFWILINIIPYIYSESFKKRIEEVYGNDFVFATLTIFGYAVIILFIYLLFKSYKTISSTDSTKKLMESIIKTRKVIKYYVIYNLVVAGISMVFGFYYVLHNDPIISKEMPHLGTMQSILVYGFLVFFSAVFILIIWLFYRLIYGLLLKRLNKNYKELEKIDD